MDIVKRPKLPTLARAIAAGFLVFVCAAPGFGQASRKMDPEPQSSASPFSWAAGYALFLLEAPDFLTISDARRHIEANGGTVAVCSDSRVMTGWIAPERIPWIAGSHGIAGVHFGPVGADLVPPEDSFGRALIGFFDTVVTGQALQLELAAKPEGFPLINDAFEHPAVDPGEVIANLAARGMNWDDGLERAAATWPSW